MQYLRAYAERADGEGATAEGPIRFVASTEGVKRDGLDLKVGDWLVDNYRANPVVLWVHDHWAPSIGKAEVSFDETRMLADITFDPEDPFAQSIESKYRRGFLNAVSVGWDDVKEENIIRRDLMDVSAVPVPADPNALMERRGRAWEAYQRWATESNPHDHSGLMGRPRAHPPHTSPKADEGAAWDAFAELTKAKDQAQRWEMHAWCDNLDKMRTYSFMHHLASGQVVWQGVAAGLAAIFQPDTQIPEEDRYGVYVHLERHYKQFDKTPPEFRSLADLEPLTVYEVRGLFLEGEPDMLPDLFPEPVHLTRGQQEKIKAAIDLLRDALDAEPAEDTDDDDELDESAEVAASLNDLLAEYTTTTTGDQEDE